jgi:hypothetical protein
MIISTISDMEISFQQVKYFKSMVNSLAMGMAGNLPLGMHKERIAALLRESLACDESYARSPSRFKV